MPRCFFFFSSRRRHTRYIGDWSSDVCSSDLVLPPSISLPLVSLVRVTRFPALCSGSYHTSTPETWQSGSPLVPSTQRSEERRVGKECRSGGGPGEAKTERLHQVTHRQRAVLR